MRSGFIWIMVFGLLLTGVVGVNLSVLRLNMRLERLGNERALLYEQNLELRSKLSRIVSSAYVERLAQTELGLVQAAPDQTTYVRLDAGGK